jgi:hypothetical protein
MDGLTERSIDLLPTGHQSTTFLLVIAFGWLIIEWKSLVSNQNHRNNRQSLIHGTQCRCRLLKQSNDRIGQLPACH